MPDRLTIAQITDLHLRRNLPGLPVSFRRRGRDVPEVLPRALALAKESGADLVALTGDLVDVPPVIVSGDDYYDVPRQRWLDAAVADYGLLKEMLDASGIRYTVLPGNHDHEPSFWQVFAREPRWFDLAQGYRVVRFFDREAELHVPRRLGRERELLEAMLTDPTSLPQIHLQHYVITPQLEGDWPYNYLEAKHLRGQLVGSGKVRLALSGHYHPGADLLCEDGTYFSTGPAFTLAPFRMSLYRIEQSEVQRQVLSVESAPLTAGKPVVFLDRDGVLNIQTSYRTGPEPLALIDGIAEAVASLRRAGWAVVVVTNQSAIGLGYVRASTVQLVNDRLCELLAEGAGPDAIPDAIVMSASAGSLAVHPKWQDVSDAKPNPSMLEEATRELGLMRGGAFMVGDRETDLLAGLAFGATPILVRTGAGRSTEATLSRQAWPDLCIVDDLRDAARQILGRSRGRV
jgi:histidinol-phosphate phosphatase family protein